MGGMLDSVEREIQVQMGRWMHGRQMAGGNVDRWVPQ